jgi:hypothetical protein
MRQYKPLRLCASAVKPFTHVGHQWGIAKNKAPIQNFENQYKNRPIIFIMGQ